MKVANIQLVGLALASGGCLYNPTINQEIADKCGISVGDYQRAETALDKGQDGMSLRAGQCRLTRSSKGVIEGVVVN